MLPGGYLKVASHHKEEPQKICSDFIKSATLENNARDFTVPTNLLWGAL